MVPQPRTCTPAQDASACLRSSQDMRRRTECVSPGDVRCACVQHIGSSRGSSADALAAAPAGEPGRPQARSSMQRGCCHCPVSAYSSEGKQGSTHTCSKRQRSCCSAAHTELARQSSLSAWQAPAKAPGGSKLGASGRATWGREASWRTSPPPSQRRRAPSCSKRSRLGSLASLNRDLMLSCQ